MPMEGRLNHINVWLLRDYNPELDLAALRAGQRMKIPTIKPRG